MQAFYKPMASGSGKLHEPDNYLDRGGEWPLVSQRMPPGIFEQFMANYHAATAALLEKADVTRALEMAVELPAQGMDEILRPEERTPSVHSGSQSQVVRDSGRTGSARVVR
jgi:hypothetical protein